MENVKSHNLISSLASPEFRQYFNNNILPVLYELERERGSYKRAAFSDLAKKLIFYIPVIAIVGLFGFFAIFGLVIKNFLLFFSIAPFVLFAFFVLFRDLRNAYNLGALKYSQVIKKGVLKILADWYSFKYNDVFDLNEGDACFDWDLVKLLCSLNIFKVVCCPELDDCFYGKYNGLHVAIEELHMYTAENRIFNTFQGLMVTVDMNKKFANHTIVRKKAENSRADKIFQWQLADMNDWKFLSFDKASLEDVEFDKKFAIYTNDQIEARYLLTTSFMKRLTGFAQKRDVVAVFKNNSAYFFIKYNKNMFEIPLSEPATNFKIYQNILVELTDVFSLIDSLKLEQDIGL